MGFTGTNGSTNGASLPKSKRLSTDLSADYYQATLADVGAVEPMFEILWFSLTGALFHVLSAASTFHIKRP